MDRLRRAARRQKLVDVGLDLGNRVDDPLEIHTLRKEYGMWDRHYFLAEAFGLCQVQLLIHRDAVVQFLGVQWQDCLASEGRLPVERDTVAI